ncbi:LysR family transcriptional regulator [uncultured Xylophilus sp.]|uniref:LysR family transcriptional regulator n=1 Tax=uncultured Xylophilus sp. TaxID=296832 RepID=UPI0025F1AE2C|nr:LysR family transcriptional regulator [uncultured Xylophilus sp.]
MELRHLRYFVAVAEAGHMTRAAAALGLQQPPLSQQIRALEAELGTVLFVRHPKGVALTDSGRVLLDEARRLLDGVGALARRMQAVAGGTAGVLAVGFTSSAAAHAFTPRVLRDCRQAFPGIALQIVEDHAAGLTEAIADGRLHCGFLRVPVARPPELAFETLLREPVLVALPVDHPLLHAPTSAPAPPKRRGGSPAAAGALRLAQLRDERFILVRRPGAPGLYADLLALCEAQGFRPQVVHEVPRMMTSLNLVAAGEGVTVVPASMQGAHPQAVAYRPLADGGPLDAPLTLAWRTAEGSAALQSFIGLVRAAVAVQADAARPTGTAA